MTEVGIIGLFPELTIGDQSNRVKAATSLCKGLSGAGNDEKVAHDVKYSFERLIKGLSANKGWSRPGFCLGLTAILSEVPEIDTAEVIEFMRTTLADKTDPDNFKGLALGRCFCMAAIVKSGRATGEHRLEVLNQLFKILIKRPYLRQLVCQVMVELIESTANLEEYSAEIAEHLTRVGPELTTNADLAYILFKFQKHSLIQAEDFRVFWGSKEIMPEDKPKKTFDKLKLILHGATSRHPKTHPIIKLICDEVLSTSVFADFWENYENESQKLPWEKKYVTMELLNYAVSATKSNDQLVPLLSGEACRLARNSLIHSERFLFHQAEAFVTTIGGLVKASDIEKQRVIFMSLLKFTPLTKQFCTAVIKNLSPKNHMWFAKWFVNALNKGKDDMFEINIGAPSATRKWLVQNLNIFIKSSPDKDALWYVVRTLIVISFFTVGKLSKKCDVGELKESREAFSPEELRETTQVLINAVIAGADFALSMKAVEFMDQIMNQKGVSTNLELSEATEDTWKTMIALKPVIKKHKYSKVLSSLTCECALSIFADSREDNVIMLNDLLELIKNDQVDESAIVEILLSLLVSESGKNRTMVLGCFRQLMNNCSLAALQLVADAINPSSGALEVEDLNEDSEDDDGVEDMSEESSQEKMNESVENESDNESEEEEEGEEFDNSDSDDEGVSSASEVDDDEEDDINHLRSRLKAAMGDAAASEDDSEDDDEMTDEQMMAMDDAIGAAFKSMTSKKRDAAAIQLQKRNFTLRVMDLADAYLTRNSGVENSFVFVTPLLNCAKTRTPSEISKKASKLLTSNFCNSKRKICKTYDQEAALDVLDRLAADIQTYNGIEYVALVQNITFFVFKCLRERFDPCQEQLTKCLQTMIDGHFAKKTTHTPLKFLQDVTERFPELIPLMIPLTKKYFTDAPNVYKKASAVELVIKAYSSASGDVLKTATETISDIFSKSEVSKHDLKVERQIDLVADLLKVMNKRSEKFMEIKDIRSKLLQVLKNEEIKSVKGFGKISTQVDMFVAKIDPSFAKKSKEDKNAQKKQQKEALLQSKIARDEARKAKFEAIKKEKMEKGEWVEKNEWKANEKRSRGVSESEKPQKKKKKFYKPNA